MCADAQVNMIFLFLPMLQDPFSDVGLDTFKANWHTLKGNSSTKQYNVNGSHRLGPRKLVLINGSSSLPGLVST